MTLPVMVDREQLKRSLGCNDRFIDEMGKILTLQLRPALVAMVHQLGNQDWAALSTNAHTLRGSVGALGATLALDQLTELERTTRESPDPLAVRQQVHDVCRTCLQLIDELKPGQSAPASADAASR